MSIEMKPIGYVYTNARRIPKSWHKSDIEGILIIDDSYIEGLRDIKPGKYIYVIFQFHKSPKFNSKYLRVIPHGYRKQKFGVFSTHSPIRPNPVGLSMLEVLNVKNNTIRVKGLDMVDGTPILDIKPGIHLTAK